MTTYLLGEGQGQTFSLGLHGKGAFGTQNAQRPVVRLCSFQQVFGKHSAGPVLREREDETIRVGTGATAVGVLGLCLPEVPPYIFQVGVCGRE